MNAGDAKAKHRAAHAAKLAAALAPASASPLLPVSSSPAPSESGPGTELRKLLKTIGIQPRGPKCKCNEHAAEMDARGPDWCEENLESIIDWLEEEAKKRPLVGLLFSRLAAREVVKLAIRRARAD